MSSSEATTEAATEVVTRAVIGPSTTFDGLSKLRADLLPTGMQVQKFSGRYVRLSCDDRWFEWNGFIYAVYNYTGNDLRPVPIENINNASLVQDDSIFQNGDVVQISSKDSPLGQSNSDIPVTAIVNWIVSILRDRLGVAIDVREMTATVESTFTNLQWAKESGFADFSSSSTGTNSAWQYRIVFASPHPTLSDVFLTLVTTIKLEADIKKESSWWGLASSTTKRFTATITALKLSVTKGFRDPSN